MKRCCLIMLLSLLVSCSPHTDTLQGYIDGEYTNLAANLSGRLQRLHVERGQSVKQGDPIFELDQEPEVSAFKKAESDLQAQQSKLKDYMAGERTTVLAGIIAQREQAQADLDLAKVNFERNQILFKKGVVSKASYDEALATLKASQQKVNQFEQNLKEAELGERQYRILEQSENVQAAQADYKQAKWRLDQKSVVAPEDGLIFDTFFNEGEQVNANQAVAALLAPRYVRLIFYIPEPLRGTLALNQRILFDFDGATQKYEAYINYISPQAEYTPPVIFSRESRMKLVFRVQAKLPLSIATKVHPGQPVDVYLEKTQHPIRFGQSLWQMLKK